MTATKLKDRVLEMASVTSVMGIGNVAGVVSLIVKSKALAILVGPAGIGIISQATQFQQVVATGGSLGLSAGLQQSLSKIKNPEDPEFRRIANLGFRLLVAMFFVTALVVLIFRRPISEAVFDSYQPGWIAAIALWLALVPISMVIDTIFVSAQRPGLFSVSRVAQFSLLAAGTVVGALLGGVGGAIWGSAIGFALAMAFIYFKCSRELGSPTISQGVMFTRETWRADRRYLSEIWGVGWVTAVAGTLTILAAFLMRTLLLHEAGEANLGQYHASFALAALLGPLVSNGIWGHFYPQVCATSDPAKCRELVTTAGSFALLALAPMFIALVIGAPILVWALFTAEFTDVVLYLPLQAASELLLQFSTIPSFLLLGRDFRFSYMLSRGIYPVLLVSLGFGLLRENGVEGLLWAQVIAALASLIVGVVLAKLRFGVTVPILLVGGAIACASALIWFGPTLVGLLAFVVS
jgi:PST family polysaccharide transporter